MTGTSQTWMPANPCHLNLPARSEDDSARYFPSHIFVTGVTIRFFRSRKAGRPLVAVSFLKRTKNKKATVKACVTVAFGKPATVKDIKFYW